MSKKNHTHYARSRMIEKFQQFTPLMHPDAWAHSSAVIIGDVCIEQHSSIWPNAVIRGDVAPIVIGKRTNIQDGSVIHASHLSPYSKQYPTTIGDDNTIGHMTHLHGCTIENLCLIGSGSIILDGSYIPSLTILGAGTLVPGKKTLESGYLYMGAPAKKIRPLTDTEKQHLQYSAQHYEQLKNQYQSL